MVPGLGAEVWGQGGCASPTALVKQTKKALQKVLMLPFLAGHLSTDFPLAQRVILGSPCTCGAQELSENMG